MNNKKIHEAKSQRITDLFFNAGARVSQTHYDFVLGILTFSHIAILEKEVEELEGERRKERKVKVGMLMSEALDRITENEQTIGYNQALTDSQNRLRKEITELRKLLK